MEDQMRRAFLSLLALSAVAAVGAASPAQARDYPFCLKAREYLAPLGDCSYTSYAQCQASASGRYAYCDVNPFYKYEEPPQRRTYKKKVRRTRD